MYTKQEASKKRQTFWTAFGQYLSLHSSITGEKVSWLNYKTGVKYFAFKMDADKDSAYIGIEISHPDISAQERLFQQLQLMRDLFESATGEEWEWSKLQTTEEGKVISRVYKKMSNVNIFREDQWPDIISFLKPRILALDRFWFDAKEIFTMTA